ncbi:polysaccharide biosynthesis/export family protein [Bradyrhizobium manausense]|uniref:polysaccharide biosynthesis/export family protein n=1 Tax=Bradyrhizobium manausense TaxID=989370 RepID=UPI001BA93400|nr:polysaccharide biosynthesis/export family protein [Bradyrhizobium manausense]MBR0688296.1 polysaccharide biosynthesis/export family protein [Bradyrhizobium manausense]
MSSIVSRVLELHREIAMNGSRRVRTFSHIAIAGLTAIVLLAGSSCFAAQYRLAAGDTVEVSIGGATEQRHRAQIQIDGTIALPGIGTVEVAGLTTAELQSRMETLLQSKILRQRLPDGREQAIVVVPGDVIASVVEYRPIYVTGDVLTPGQLTYRSSMTVRQAVAVSGGYSLLRSRNQPGTSDPADLLRDYQSLSTEYVKEYFHILRVDAELADKEAFDQTPPRDISLPASAIAPIVQAEAESLKTAQRDYRKERTFLEDAVKQADAQFAALSKQQEGEEKGVQADEEELDRVVKLFGSGSLPSPRVTESRRALLLSSTRRLQTTVELMRLQRQREDSARQIDRAASQRTITLLRELKDSNVHIADLRIRMKSVGQKLQPVNGSAAVPAGTGDLKPQVTLVRKSGQSWEKIVVSEDYDLEPGDVIEIALRPHGGS